MEKCVLFYFIYVVLCLYVLVFLYPKNILILVPIVICAVVNVSSRQSVSRQLDNGGITLKLAFAGALASR